MVLSNAADLTVIVTGNYPETNHVNSAETSKLVIGEEATLSWSPLPVSKSNILSDYSHSF